MAFVRIGTNPRAFPSPLTIAEAVHIVSDWFDQPNVQIMEPTERHWTTLAPLLTQSQVKGALVTDAHLAAIALEHGASLCSSDGDFASRFTSDSLFHDTVNRLPTTRSAPEAP